MYTHQRVPKKCIHILRDAIYVKCIHILRDVTYVKCVYIFLAPSVYSPMFINFNLRVVGACWLVCLFSCRYNPLWLNFSQPGSGL